MINLNLNPAAIAGASLASAATFTVLGIVNLSMKTMFVAHAISHESYGRGHVPNKNSERRYAVVLEWAGHKVEKNYYNEDCHKISLTEQEAQNYATRWNSVTLTVLKVAACTLLAGVVGALVGHKVAQHFPTSAAAAFLTKMGTRTV